MKIALLVLLLLFSIVISIFAVSGFGLKPLSRYELERGDRQNSGQQDRLSRSSWARNVTQRNGGAGLVRRRLKAGASWERHQDGKKDDQGENQQQPNGSPRRRSGRSGLPVNDLMNRLFQNCFANLTPFNGLAALVKGGCDMTQPNQVQKLDDFRLEIIFKIEGQNSRAFMLRILGIAAALVAVSVKVILLVMSRAP